jgi:hypothetical protein
MVRVKEWKRNGKQGWEVDLRLIMPDGKRFRERVKSPVTSRSGTVRWAQAREAGTWREVDVASPSRSARCRPSPRSGRGS